MRSEWLKQPGETGVVQLTQREGDWLVTNPSIEGETKCILHGGFELSESDSTVEVKLRVKKYVSASGGGASYLFAEPADSEIETTETPVRAYSDDVSTRSETGRHSSRLSLTDLSGSGEFVTVEAIIDDIFWVRKDQRQVPDLAGALRDEKSRTRQMFVVGDQVNHPYLEEGRRFVFQNAKDHYYENGDKVQLLITQHTDFIDKGLTSKKGSSSSQKQSSKSATTSSSAANNSLHQIAKSMLGDEEFTVKQQRESSVSKAKKKAKRQQRDPAIDPKLNKDP